MNSEIPKAEKLVGRMHRRHTKNRAGSDRRRDGIEKRQRSGRGVDLELRDDAVMRVRDVHKLPGQRRKAVGRTASVPQQHREGQKRNGSEHMTPKVRVAHLISSREKGRHSDASDMTKANEIYQEIGQNNKK